MSRSILSELEQRMVEPTSRGLAAAVGRAIRDQVLTEHDRLPPIRTVATQLGLSPTTVSAAWATLRRAGAIETSGRRGTVVAIQQPGPSRYRQALANQGMYTLDLSTGTPDPALLPDLTAALHRIEPPPEPESYLDRPVLAELADLLREDWPFVPERITMVDGAMDALELISTVHLRVGDTVAVENPAFPPLLDLLDASGVTVLPVDVDDDGPVPGGVRDAVEAGAVALFIQPRAQNPTGATLTADRAGELAVALRGADTLIVEDDSAGAGAAHPTISLGAALPGRTLHVRSYSKLYGPDLRLAALGGPADLVDPLVDRRFLGQGWTSRLLQRVLLDLLTNDDASRTVRQAQAEYTRRRAWFADGLADRGVMVGGTDGLNLWMPVADEKAAQLLLATRGIGASAGETFSIRPHPPPYLRLTTGRVSTGREVVLDALTAASHAGRQPAVR